jgi:hypothetical protein
MRPSEDSAHALQERHEGSRGIGTCLRGRRVAHTEHGRRDATGYRVGGTANLRWPVRCTEPGLVRNRGSVRWGTGLPGNLRKQSHICGCLGQWDPAHVAVVRFLRWQLHRISCLPKPALTKPEAIEATESGGVYLGDFGRSVAVEPSKGTPPGLIAHPQHPDVKPSCPLGPNDGTKERRSKDVKCQ